MLQPTAGDQPQPQVNEGGTPRIPNGSRGGQPSPWNLLLRYHVGSAGQITSGRICLSDQVKDHVGSAGQITSGRICLSDQVEDHVRPAGQ